MSAATTTTTTASTASTTTTTTTTTAEQAIEVVKNTFSSSMKDCCALPKCVIRRGQSGIELKACGACTIPY